MHASAQEGDQRRTPALLSRRIDISSEPVIHHGNDLICARPQNPALSRTDLTPPAFKAGANVACYGTSVSRLKF